VRPSGQAGFTLVELLLVVVIVGVVGALVWPNFVRLDQSLELRSAARDVVGVAARARLEALSRREPVELQVGPDALTVLRPQARYDGEEEIPEDGEEPLVLEIPLSDKVVLTRLQVLPAENGPWCAEEKERSETVELSEGAAITFYPDGTSDDALIGLSRAVTVQDESEYYVRLRGLVARAVVLRTLSDSDERVFFEVADVAQDW